MVVLPFDVALGDASGEVGEDLLLPELEHPAQRSELREVLHLEERAAPGAQLQAGVLGRGLPIPAAEVLQEEICLAERGIVTQEAIELVMLSGTEGCPGPHDEV